MNHYIAIAGNIGVGKTTVTRLVAERLGWKAYYEPVIDNPYLDDFYKDMARWSFHLQVYFLSKRFEAQREISQSTQSCIQDRTIYEDVEIFARTLHLQGYMTPRDFENYSALFHAMVSFLRAPDLIVYLRADVNQLLARINARGRDSERAIRRDYLTELNHAYEGWAERATKICPVTILDTHDLDPDGENGVAERIVESVRERFGVMF
ncbi:MAG TPA: deoxynucleoside kinase [Bacteroidetes bacterium]|nr:deoxynucleoside kinase [Bacteroidota bacterium]